MELQASEIAKIISGTLVGDPDRFINRVASLERADERALSFFANKKFASQFKHSKAGIIIVSNELKLDLEDNRTLIKSANPALSFNAVLKLFDREKHPTKSGIEPMSFIHPSAVLGKDCYVGSFAYIGENVVIGDCSIIHPQSWVGSNSKIGSHTTIFSGAKIYPESIIGNHCILHAGAVIGSDGFGFTNEDGQLSKKIPQLGIVILEDHVEIGANTVIDRATLDATIIKTGVKLDNLIQIGHNVIIGENTMIAAQTGVAGSVQIGKNTMIGGQSGIAGHIKLADGTKVQGQTGVTKNTNPGDQLYGTPGIQFKQFLKSYALFKQLPEMNKKINLLLNQLNSKK